MEDTHYYILSPIACNEITIDEFWRLQGRTDGPPRPAEPTEEDVKKKLIEYGVKDPFVVKVVQDTASVVTFMWVDLHDVDFLPDVLGALRKSVEPDVQPVSQNESMISILRTLVQAKLHSVVHSFHSFNAFCDKLIEEKGIDIDDEIRDTMDDRSEELLRKRSDLLISIAKAGEEEVKKIEEELERYTKTIRTIVKKIIPSSVPQPVTVSIAVSDPDVVIDSRIADLEKELDNKNSECTTLQKELSEAKNKNSNITQELEQVKQKRDDLERQLAAQRESYEAQLKALREAYESQEAQLKTLQGQMDDLKKDKGELIARMDEKDQQIKDQQARLEAAQAQMKKFSEKKPTIVVKPPDVVGKKYVFKQVKGSGDDYIYLMRTDEYRFLYFYLEKNFLKSSGIAPGKDITCEIQHIEQHTSTELPEDQPFIAQYNVRLGVDYFLCTGKLSQ